LIIKLNNDSNTNAIVIQLPLPVQIDTNKIIGLLKPRKDADALNEKTKITPPTVGAIMAIFSHYRISLKDKNIVIVGHGKLVGKPLSMYFDKHGIKYEICDKNTANLAKKTLNADVIIAGTGSPHLIKKNMVKKNVVIIDAGTAVEKTSDNKSKVLGDVDFENVQLIASYITPPTGGVGPITVAKLLENVVALVKKND
jgi:methylenetetrahydrofolate dehydrogenase (NADP+)/methenyltetrahydrofolate cyclohydrolase